MMWWVLTVGCGGAVPVAPGPPPPEVGAAVRVGVSAGCFSHLGPGALGLGARLLARHLSVDLGRPAELQICDSPESLARVMIERDLDVVMLPGEMLVESKRAGQPLAAWVMSGSAHGSETSWILLVPSSGGSIPRPGSTVLLADGGRARLPSFWLRGLGSRAAGGSAESPFREVIEPHPELAVLRVFLGKADGCVVPESAFLAACADNPQLSDRLVRVASSPPLPGAVVCGRTSESNLFADRLPAALARLALTPHGRALATLLGTGEFAAFDPALLPALERLVENGSKSSARPDGVSKASSSSLPVPSR